MKWLSALVISIVVLLMPIAAQQSTPYILSDFPVAAIFPDSAIWIKWTGISRNPLDPDMLPDSGTIYYSSAPGGSKLSNYKFSVSTKIKDTVIKPPSLPQRGIKFKPSANTMTAGIYYIIVAFATKIGIKDTIFYSNEVPLIIEAVNGVSLSAPAAGAVITDLTPTFQWTKVSGVPYYHVIVSDEEIKISSGSSSVSGISIIWQAITVNTQMSYGAPDPSGTITASPPPLSPGKKYSWVVLNNYGNHPAYSSTRVFSIPSSFTIAGDTLKKPVNIWKYQDTITYDTLPQVRLQWKNLDTKANTYQIYIYMKSNLANVGAQLVVWNTEVTAKAFTNDTGYCLINPKSVLTENRYTWKVIAVDAKGGGTGGDTTGFFFKIPSGDMNITTKENIVSGNTTIAKEVGLVEIKVEALDGSLEAPLLFYTDQSGTLSRKRPAGTYKLTTLKEGFESQTKTVTITNGGSLDVTFYLKRPDATIFGKVVDEAGNALNLATVQGVSERKDTVKTQTDPQGNFILICNESDWRISASKSGYISTLEFDTTVYFGQNIQFNKPLVLKNNPYTLSGVIKNESGDPLLGVSVKLQQDGRTLAEVPSTPQTGAFSFALSSGTYSVNASKIGFTSVNKTITVFNSQQIQLTLQSGAALIRGSVVGKGWNSQFVRIYSPIPKANIWLVDTSGVLKDTIQTTADAVYGNFSASVVGNKVYRLIAKASGYVSQTVYPLISVEPAKTYVVSDTLSALATLSGTIHISDTAASSVGGATINILDSATNAILSSATSDAIGTFQINGIADGASLKIQSGKSNRIQDSVIVTDSSGSKLVTTSIKVIQGRVVRPDNSKPVSSIVITMRRGSKALTFLVHHNLMPIPSAVIKLKSPLVKNLKGADTLSQIGHGRYIMDVSSGVDSIVSCALHQYVIPDAADSFYIDTVSLPVVYTASDSMILSGSQVKLTLNVRGKKLDTGYVFFKNINSPLYDSVPYTSFTQSGSDYQYLFSPKVADASYLQYYFKVTIGSSIYGYENQYYRSYIKPDTTVVTRLSVTPSTQDTAFFAADADIRFTFAAYYGSNFKPLNALAPANVTWKLVNPQGATLKQDSLRAVLHTSANSTGTVAIVQGIFIPSSTITLASGVSDTVSVLFRMSSSKLDSIVIKRTDDNGQGYITTSPLDKAEFVAQGLDKNRAPVTITPLWSISPTNAGSIVNGVFKPAINFIGTVSILAQSGKVAAEYYDASKAQIGLNVRYLLSRVADTVTYGDACRLFLPDSCIRAPGKLSLELPKITNDLMNSTVVGSSSDTSSSILHGKFDLIGSVYSITDVDSVLQFRASTNDSITIALTIPENHSNPSLYEYYIARWKESDLGWDPLENSVLGSDSKSISVHTRHFSQYAILARPKNVSADVTIKPNPFSPYVRPVAEYGLSAPYGACIEVSATSPSSPKVTIDLDIYNVVGEKVWSAQLANAVSSNTYRVFWDGKTALNRVSLPTLANGLPILKAGQTLCKNGRYFVITTVHDNGKKKQFSKQIILFK